MNRFIVLFLLSITISSCTVNGDIDNIDYPAGETEILWGNPVPHEMYPSIIVLMEAATGRIRCTGSLIKHNIVMTAGHCIDPDDVPQNTFYAIGIETVNGICDECGYAGKAVGRHPNYKDKTGNYNDIALVLLEGSIDAPTANLLVGKGGLEEGMPVTIAGYGRDENNTAGTLIAGSTIISEIWDDEMIIGEDIPKTVNACFGDSGGPAYIDVNDGRYVAGITSRTATGTADCGHGAIYTIVGSHRDWIEKCAIDLEENRSCKITSGDDSGAGSNEPPVVIEPSSCSQSPPNKTDTYLLLIVLLAFGAAIYIRKACK